MNAMPASGKGKVVLIVFAIILVPLVYSAASTLLARDAQDGKPFLEKPAERGTEDGPCDGRAKVYMRYHHMDFLKELRDEVIRDGIRKDAGLARCHDCHPSRDRFCNKCHDAVNLKPDCFGCHYYP